MPSFTPEPRLPSTAPNRRSAQAPRARPRVVLAPGAGSRGLTRPLPAALLTVLLTAGAASAPARAAAPVPTAPEAAATQPPDVVRDFVERQVPPGAGRMEVAVGSLDPRLRLAPCARIEPYLLPGTRLWGRTSIGVRCVDGARWTVALPVTVTVHGPALVAAEPLPAGTRPSAASVRIEEVELTREPGTPVTDEAQLVGRSLTRTLAPGQVLRVEHLRASHTVAPGDPVRIQVVGPGFVIHSEGRALAGAADGQTLRVRTENGRIVSGTLRGRTVEIGI